MGARAVGVALVAALAASGTLGAPLAVQTAGGVDQSDPHRYVITTPGPSAPWGAPSPEIIPAPAGESDFLVVLPALVAHSNPDVSPVSPSMEDLRAALQTTVAAYPGSGRVAVAVTDLETGETVSVNGDRLQFAGCAINLAVLVLALQDVADGRLALVDVADLVRATIRTSNPTTARELYILLGDGDVIAGVRRVSVALRTSWGLPGIILDHPPGYLGESLSGGSSNLATAVAMNWLLVQLHRGDLLPAEEQAFLLDALAGVYPGLNYLLGTLEGVATVRHKNGFFPLAGEWIDNDTGIIEFESADGTPRAFVMTFLAEAVPGLFADVPLAQALAWTAYEHFSSRGP